ncbi:MAG: AMP-binding protein, partial [Pirellulaceae bacterium]
MIADQPLLHVLLRDSATKHPDAEALRECAGAAICYQDLDLLSSRFCQYLQGIGVGKGDRVGLCLGKSIDAVAAIFGILKAGAAYVPVDPAAPAARSAQIFLDCEIRLLVLDATLPSALQSELARYNHDLQQLELQGTGGGKSLAAALDSAMPTVPSGPAEVEV